MQAKESNDTPLHQQMLDRYHKKTIRDSRSPAGNWLEVVLEHAEKGAVSLSMIIRPEMTNPYGNIHGGMMGALIDETIGWAVVSLDATHHYTSLNLNVDFLYAASQGARIIAAAKVIRHGKKIVHAECHVTNESGQLLAKASSNLVVTSMAIENTSS